MSLKDFRGEVWTNVHPEIMNELVRINGDAVDGKVGNDSYTRAATRELQKYFDDEIRVVYAVNGTAANILALKSMLERWASVLCEEHTHINTHECGAFESMLGNKILAIQGEAGKLSARLIENYLERIKSYKYLPRAVVLTQPTELGVLYTNEEIREICDLAHSRGMYVYVDGARLPNALVALDTTLTEMIESTGVDAFSFGGTKAGAMFGEAVIFRRSEHFAALEYLQKQALQHLDKSKFLGVQMQYLLERGLWRETAAHANAMAKYLESCLAQKGISPCYAVETNTVFCVLSEEQLECINQRYDVSYWDRESRVVRLVTSFSTCKEAIDELVALL
ncbi:MAG: hypothetical protein J6M03_01425 [Clostridia bacterium]|nr:hypothetical protein [Clostridia bacterium]